MIRLNVFTGTGKSLATEDQCRFESDMNTNMNLSTQLNELSTELALFRGFIF